ncbi:MAG: S8/S53 family peptidase [Myxococcota bacterium]
MSAWCVALLTLQAHPSRAAGILVFASAGNDGADVDAEDCFIGCWEGAYRVPCEAPGVICVGGLTHNSTSKDPSSAGVANSVSPTAASISTRPFQPGYTMILMREPQMLSSSMELPSPPLSRQPSRL